MNVNTGLGYTEVRAAATDISVRTFRCAAAAILLLALALRLIAARGDLWLDEIWTLTLLRPLTSPDQIFWKVNSDNNHFLNSLWMSGLGPYRSPLLYRLPAVVLGVAGVGTAGYWARRHGRFAALVAMLLFAVPYSLVDFGAEARGYAGFILFTIMALICVEAALEGKPVRARLGLAMLLGVLCHLLMFVTAFALACWAFWADYRRSGKLSDAILFTARLFAVAFVLMLPVFCEIMLAVVHHRFGMGVGRPLPFEPGLLLRVYGRIVEASTALPFAENPLIYVALAIMAVLLRYRSGPRDDVRPVFYVVAVVVVPGMLLLGQVPNTGQPRFFLLSALALLLLIADCAGEQWRSGSVPRRIATLVALAIILAGDGLLLARFLSDGRGHYAAAMQSMASAGPARYFADPKTRNPIVEDYYIQRDHLALTYVAQDGWCAAPPQYLLVYQRGHGAPDPQVTAGPPECPGVFASPRLFAQWGFGGTPWIVYRRQ